MVKTCMAYGCAQKFEKGSDISFFSVPKDSQRRQQWLAALHQKHIELKPFHVLCSKHFKESDFNQETVAGKRTLKSHAVPSIFDTKNKSKRRVQSRKLSESSENDSVKKKSKYNLRQRKPEPNDQPPEDDKNLLDHTYSSSPNEDNPNVEISATLNDHAYTNSGIIVKDSKSKRSVEEHRDHSYSIGTNQQKRQKTIKPPKKTEIIEEPPKPDNFEEKNEKENLKETIDLRDHTYSKNEKRRTKGFDREEFEKFLNTKLTINTALFPTRVLKVEKSEELNLNVSPSEPLVDTPEKPRVPIEPLVKTPSPLKDANMDARLVLNQILDEQMGVEKPKVDESPSVIFVNKPIIYSTPSSAASKSPRDLILSQPKLILPSEQELSRSEATINQNNSLKKGKHRKASKKQPVKKEEVPPTPPTRYVECVLVHPIKKQRILTREFQALKPSLIVLEPSEENMLIDETGDVDTKVHYVLTYPKKISTNKPEDKTQLRMERTHKLFKEVFGTAPCTEEIHEVKGLDSDLCCSSTNYADVLLKTNAFRKNFSRPQTVDDFTIHDMDSHQNAKRYFQLSSVLMERQKYLIRKLRVTNSKMGNDFRKLSIEIMNMRKKTPKAIENSTS